MDNEQPIQPQPPHSEPEPQPSGVPSPMEPKMQGENPKKLGGGMMKWVGIGAGVLAVGGIALAGLYFGGVFTPKPSETDLMGSAPETSSEEAAPVQTQVQTQANTQALEEFSGVTQIALTTCTTGQVQDPVTKRCTCDINNNYFEINLDGAFGKPTTGLSSISCTTCAAINDEIFKLSKSNNPADTSRKAQLEVLASAQNCTPCAIFDDRIAEALQNKKWMEYYDLVVQKSQDNTCGRTLPVCDSLKWQIIFLSDLRVKAAKDSISPAELERLKAKQETLAQELGTNTACYKLENLCADLKTAYGNPAATPTSGTQTPSTAPSSATQSTTNIGSTPLMGTVDSSKSSTSQQVQPTTKAGTQEVSSADGTQVNLAAAETAKLFSEEFYLMHCPIDGVDGTAPPPATPPKKVKRSQ